MSEGTTTGGGSAAAELLGAATQGPGELDGSESGSTLAATKRPTVDEDDDGRMHIMARCHIGGRLAAWVGEDNRLTIACGECWKPVITVDHHGLFASLRALGCDVPGCRHEGHNHGQ